MEMNNKEYIFLKLDNNNDAGDYNSMVEFNDFDYWEVGRKITLKLKG